MDSIYLSYSGRNCEAVLQVMEGIIARGYALACDCVLPGHEDFDLRVTRAMKAAKAVLAVMTEDAAACPYMQRELALAEALEVPVVTVLVDMKMGSEEATAWGCDLTYDYVKINADYRS